MPDLAMTVSSAPRPLRWVAVRVADGSTMRAFVAHPMLPGPHPGIVLLHDAFGVNTHLREVAARFAGRGFVTIAPELFHRTWVGLEGDDRDVASVLPHVRALTRDGLAADVRAAYAWLCRDPGVDPARTAAVGYGVGGRAAFLANAIAPLSAAVAYSASGIAPDLLGLVSDLHAPQLLHWGGRDAHVPPSERHAVTEALRAAGKPFVSVEYSEAEEGFFRERGPQFHAASAAESWALTLGFLQHRLDPHT